MIYSYDHSFSDEQAAGLRKAVESPDLIQTYSFDIEDGFLSPPLKEQIKLFNMFVKDDSGDEFDDFKDKIAHYCIKGKNVTIKLDGEVLGKFQIASIDDSWDAFEILCEHPIALRLLINTAAWSVVGKFMPPLRKEAGAVAAKTTKK